MVQCEVFIFFRKENQYEMKNKLDKFSSLFQQRNLYIVKQTKFISVLINNFTKEKKTFQFTQEKQKNDSNHFITSPHNNTPRNDACHHHQCRRIPLASWQRPTMFLQLPRRQRHLLPNSLRTSLQQIHINHRSHPSQRID